MRSSIYMNHCPDFTTREREAVAADLSRSVAELANPETRLGHVVQGTLYHLGVEIVGPSHSSDMLLIGRQDDIEKRRSNLGAHIGEIVRGAMKKDSPTQPLPESWLKRHVHSIADDDRMRPRAFIQSTGDILSTFGDDCNPDGCRVFYGVRPLSPQKLLELQAEVQTTGEQIVTRYIRLLPEAALARQERTEKDRLVLLRGVRWVVGQKEYTKHC